MSHCAAPPPSESALQTKEQPLKDVQSDDANRYVTDLNSRMEYSAFDTKSKRCIVLLCALAGFFSPFSAFTYFPALNYIGDDLEVSLQLMNLSITVFLVIQAIAPPLLGDIADQIGRRPVYLLVLLVYFVACIGLALQRSYPALLVFRMIQSFGSSGTIALGIMVVADLAPPHDRGRYVGAMLSGPNSGPSIGPVIGGVLTKFAGWPWIFWLLAILGGLCFLPFVLLLPETCRNIVGNGSYTAGRRNKPLLHSLSPRIRDIIPISHDAKPCHKLRMFPNPFNCLRIVFQRHDALLLSSNALFYLTYSCLQASLAPLLMQHYGLDALQAGLCYLPYGIACIAASYLVGKVLDIDYRITARKAGITIHNVSGDNLASFPVERARIRSIFYFVVGGICSSVGFGWAVETDVHLSVPLILTFILGVTCTGVFTTCLTLNVDLHPAETGLASVAASFTRCLAAAVGVLCLQPLLNSVGVGWTFTLFGLLCALSIPMLLTLRYQGYKWRNCEGDNDGRRSVSS